MALLPGLQVQAGALQGHQRDEGSIARRSDRLVAGSSARDDDRVDDRSTFASTCRSDRESLEESKEAESTNAMIGERILIEVAGLEFVEGGNTLWVHGTTGGTVLRIRCSGKITVKPHCTNSVAHADMQVVGDIEICLPDGEGETDPRRDD